MCRNDLKRYTSQIRKATLLRINFTFCNPEIFEPLVKSCYSSLKFTLRSEKYNELKEKEASLLRAIEIDTWRPLYRTSDATIFGHTSYSSARHFWSRRNFTYVRPLF